jgi:hypothetical protein
MNGFYIPYLDKEANRILATFSQYPSKYPPRLLEQIIDYHMETGIPAERLYAIADYLEEQGEKATIKKIVESL